MSSQASSQGWLRHVWLIPAGLAAAAVGLLCWGAWGYGYDALWFARSPAWLRDILQTDQNWTPLVTMALLLTGLGIYWWPRRGKNIPIGLIAVLVLTGFSGIFNVPVLRSIALPAVSEDDLRLIDAGLEMGVGKGRCAQKS